MSKTSMSRKLRDLAQMMIRQAQMLRDLGDAGEARRLARRSVLIRDLGWRVAQPALIPARARSRR
ncbi:MAG: hypothetical protein ACFB2Z_03625 [Maricaulaceae bacterium]